MHINTHTHTYISKTKAKSYFSVYALRARMMASSSYFFSLSLVLLFCSFVFSISISRCRLSYIHIYIHTYKRNPNIFDHIHSNKFTKTEREKNLKICSSCISFFSLLLHRPLTTKERENGNNVAIVIADCSRLKQFNRTIKKKTAFFFLKWMLNHR